MAITPTNQTKNSISPTRNVKGGYYFWGDSVATWGDSVAQWGSPTISVTNQSKNAISPTKNSKS